MAVNAFPTTLTAFICFIAKATKEISATFDIQKNSFAHEENLILLCKYNIYII